MSSRISPADAEGMVQAMDVSAGARPRIALALGSGGARGYAHIGVIEVLEERGYDVSAIAGTSMGALVGGLHAAGQLDHYTDWVCGLSQRDVLRMLDPSVSAPGFIKADKIVAKVSELVGDVAIEGLELPFTAVATDLLARKEVWFQEGPLYAAIRASIALPTFMTPVMINGRLLGDGGLMNPVPVAATTAARVDATVAVSLSGEDPGQGGTSPVHETARQRPTEEWIQGFRRTAERLLDRDAVTRLVNRFARQAGLAKGSTDPSDEVAEAMVEEVFDALPPGLRMRNVMELSLDALQSVVVRHRLAGYPPDLLITVPKSSCRTLDFHRAPEMIALGRRLATQAIDDSNLLAT